MKVHASAGHDTDRIQLLPPSLLVALYGGLAADAKAFAFAAHRHCLKLPWRAMVEDPRVTRGIHEIFCHAVCSGVVLCSQGAGPGNAASVPGSPQAPVRPSPLNAGHAAAASTLPHAHTFTQHSFFVVPSTGGVPLERRVQASSSRRPPCAGGGTIVDDLYVEDDRLADDCFDPEPSSTPSSAPSPTGTPSVTPTISRPVDNLGDLVNGLRDNGTAATKEGRTESGFSAALAGGLSAAVVVFLLVAVLVTRKVFQHMDAKAEAQRKRDKLARMKPQVAHGAGSLRRRASVVAMQGHASLAPAVTGQRELSQHNAAASAAALAASSALFSGKTITEQLEAKRRQDEVAAAAAAAAMKRPRSSRDPATSASGSTSGDCTAYAETFGRSRTGSLIVGQRNPALAASAMSCTRPTSGGRNRESSVSHHTDAAVLKCSPAALGGIAIEISAAKGTNTVGQAAGSVRVNPLSRAAMGATAAPNSAALAMTAGHVTTAAKAALRSRRERRCRQQDPDNSPPSGGITAPASTGPVSEGELDMSVFFPADSKRGPAPSAAASSRRPVVSGHSGAVRVRRKR